MSESPSKQIALDVNHLKPDLLRMNPKSGVLAFRSLARPLLSHVALLIA